MDWILYRQMYCWLLAAFAFFFLFLSFPFISSQKLAPKNSQKIGPKKVGPLYLLAPLLITSGSQLTSFTFPLLITTRHYSQKPTQSTISSTEIPSLKQATKIQTKLHKNTSNCWRWSKQKLSSKYCYNLPPKMLWNVVVPPTSSEYLACSPVFFGLEVVFLLNGMGGADLQMFQGVFSFWMVTQTMQQWDC